MLRYAYGQSGGAGLFIQAREGRSKWEVVIGSYSNRGLSTAQKGRMRVDVGVACQQSLVSVTAVLSCSVYSLGVHRPLETLSILLGKSDVNELLL